MRVNVLLSVTIILISGVSLVLLFQLPGQITGHAQNAQLWSPKDEIDYANMLLAKGLRRQAASVFEKYIDAAAAGRPAKASGRLRDKREIAKVCYRLGSIYMDLSQYEKALASFYRAEMLNKKADFTAEMNQKIVEALENLGLSSQARYELAKRASLGGKAKQAGEVVARIGKRDITRAEIDRALAAVPEWMRKQLAEGERRLDFIRNYVATEVLYEKAKRLGIDKEERVRRALENTKKQLVVQDYLGKEVEKKLKIDPQDLKNYYKANKDKYTEPAKIKVRYVEFSKEREKEEALKKLSAGKAAKVEGWIERGAAYLNGIGEAKDAIEKLFLKEKGERAGPLKIKDKSYIFSIEDKRAERTKAFAEVKAQVEREYRAEKEHRITAALLSDALEEQEVEIYPLKDKKEQKAQP